MFPPRTEAPTADKLTLCYAPHVDMTTVIEVEVRRFFRFRLADRARALFSSHSRRFFIRVRTNKTRVTLFVAAEWNRRFSVWRRILPVCVLCASRLSRDSLPLSLSVSLTYLSPPCDRELLLAIGEREMRFRRVHLRVVNRRKIADVSLQQQDDDRRANMGQSARKCMRQLPLLLWRLRGHTAVTHF